MPGFSTSILLMAQPLRGGCIKLDSHNPTETVVGGGLYRVMRYRDIIGSPFSLGESPLPSRLPDLPSRSWISHGENSKRQPSSIREPLLMSLCGTDGMGYRVKELPLQLIWAFIFSSATPGSLRTPRSSLDPLFLRIINSLARNFWRHLGKCTDYEKVI